jgi:hypothetical protein
MAEVLPVRQPGAPLSPWVAIAVPVVLAVLAGRPLEAASPAAPEPPRLLVEAPERYAAVADRLERLPPERFVPAMGMIGLERAGAPIRVALVTEAAPEARSSPLWVAGYAYGALGRIVLFIERTPAYPDGSIEALLDHEVAHVLIARAAAHHPVPRWFNEGVSMVAGHAWGIADTSRLTLAAITASGLTSAELEAMFKGDSGEVQRAYAVSGAMVRDLLRRYDRQAVARTLGGLRLGLGFEEAFLRATGATPSRFEAAFWRRHSFWYRWVPLLGSSVTLWFGVTLLALLAFRRRRRRDAEIRARWELEEALERRAEPPGEIL